MRDPKTRLTWHQPKHFGFGFFTGKKFVLLELTYFPFVDG
jgi:hypothetical protein